MVKICYFQCWSYQIWSEQHIFILLSFALYNIKNQSIRAMSLIAPLLLARNINHFDSKSEPSTDGDEVDQAVSFKNNTLSKKVKSSLCRNFSEYGSCPYGVKCKFAHGLEELRCNVDESSYKTKPCKQFSTKSFCPYGLRCNFSHTNQINQNCKQKTKQKRHEFWDIVYCGKMSNGSKILAILE